MAVIKSGNSTYELIIDNNGSAKVILTDGNGTTIDMSVKDFFLEVSKGNVPGVIDYSAFGINTDIDIATVPEDITATGGIFVAPTTYRVHDITSASANDTAAGTGARTVAVYGVTANGLENEVITMNGVANVPTTKMYSDIYRMFILTAGSGNTNAGAITATAQTDATVTCTIPVDGFNSCRKCIRLIPPGYTGYLFDFQASMYCATAGSYADCYLLIGSTTISLPKAYHSLSNTGNSNETDNFLVPLQVSAGTWIKARTTVVSNNNTLLNARFNLILVAN